MNMPVLTADQINRIEEYRGSSEERLNVDARIREVVADGKSFLDMAKESFVKIFGQGYEAGFECKRETVEEAMTRMYVDGQTYKERFGIEDITKDNYELAACHIYYYMTYGPIATSQLRDQMEMYGGPMKVTVLNTSTATNKLFTAVVPQEPQPVKKPSQPNGWKRFWNRFGFYKRDMEEYQDQVKKYDDYVADKAVYDENVRKTQEEAERMEQRVMDRDGITDERRNQVHAVMQNQEKRAELHEAAKDALQTIPKNDKATSLSEVQQYIPEYTEGFAKKPFMNGMGRDGSVANQLLAYMAAVNDMTLEEAINAPKEVKLEAGKQFKELFMEAEPLDTQDEKEIDEIRKAQMEKAADALARMYRHWGEEQINAVDVLDPESIRENAAHNMRLGQIGMDIAQMLRNDGVLADLVAERMGGKGQFQQVKSAFGAAKSASGPLESLCKIYAEEKFRDQEVPGTAARLTDAATALFGGERIDSRIAGKPLKDFEIKDSAYIMAACKMDRDDPKEISDVLNGKDVRLSGKLNMNYMVKCASEKPLEVREQTERRRTSINELTGQNQARQNAARERLRQQPERQHTPNQPVRR